MHFRRVCFIRFTIILGQLAQTRYLTCTDYFALLPNNISTVDSHTLAWTACQESHKTEIISFAGHLISKTHGWCDHDSILANDVAYAWTFHK